MSSFFFFSSNHEYTIDSRLSVQDLHQRRRHFPTQQSNEEHSCEPVGFVLCVRKDVSKKDL